MNVRVAILDDDPNDLNQVKEYFENASFSFVKYNCDSYLKTSPSFYEQYDVYIIDIELNQENGLEVARELRKMYPHAVLILNSKRNDLVFDSFQIGVFFFTRKDHFEKDMEIAQIKLNEYFKLMNQKYHYCSKELIYDIPYKDIIYVEKINHHIYIHLKDKVLVEQQSMKNIVKHFDQSMFFQCHQSYLVNLSHVKYLNKYDFIMSNKEQVQISKRFYQQTKKAYITYLSNKVSL